jgi:peptidoglycan/LPS O-acetylase OafA/YrhL
MQSAKHAVLPALTGFRFLSALFVLLGHGCTVIQFNGTNAFGIWMGPLAGIGMTLFFVLSGFLMWFNYGEAFKDNSAGGVIYDFAIARFARLYPMLFCTLLLGAAVTPWQTLFGVGRDVFLFPAMMNAWVPGTGPVPLALAIPSVAHTWSISGEIFCYLLFPVFALSFCRVRSRAAILSLAFAMLATLTVISHLAIRYHASFGPIAPKLVADGQLYMWLSYYSPITRIFEFGLGCFTAIYFLSGDKSRVPGWLIMWTAIAAMGVGLYAFVGPDLWIFTGYRPSFIRFLLAGAAALMVYGLARHPRNLLSLILSTRPAQIGGDISYSTYLLHPFLLAGFIHPIVIELTWSGFAEWCYVLLAALGSVYFVSYATYRFIEVPARRWIRAGLSRQPAQRLVPSFTPELAE